MRKFLLIVFMLLLFVIEPLFSKKMYEFSEIGKPSKIYLNQDSLYIVEFPLIYIHSLKDFHLVKRIGKKGEGPGEFLVYARIHFLPDYNIIHSQTKFSYYSKDWKYIKERRVPIQFDRGVKFIGDLLVVSHTEPGLDNPDKTALTVNIYSADFKKIREIYRQKYYFQKGHINGIYLAEIDRRLGIRFSVWNKRIYVEGEDGENGNVYIYDQKGEKIDSLHLMMDKLQVAAEHKTAVKDFFKLRRRRVFSIVKARGWLDWPDYFPAVRFFSVMDDKIFIIPYLKKHEKNRLLIFNLKGRLEKHLDIPLEEESIFYFYPFTIYKGKIYQLIENEEAIWELHVFEI